MKPNKFLGLLLGAVLAAVALAPFGSPWIVRNGVLYPANSAWKVAKASPLIVAGQNHTLVLMGDSNANGTPLGAFPVNNYTGPMNDLFALDPAYTRVTGGDLGPTTDTTVAAWSLSNATWTQGTETLTLTTSTAGFGFWSSRGLFRPNVSPNGIDISANPTSRYRLCWDVDASSLLNATQPPAANYNAPTAVSTNVEDLDYWIVNARADGATCGGTLYLAAENGSLSGPISYASGMPEAAGTRHCLILDPTAWSHAGDNYSGTPGFADSACRVDITFQAFSERSDAARVVTFTNISFEQVTASVRFIPYGVASQTLGGVREDNWPAARGSFHCTDNSSNANCLASRRPNPVSAVILSVGGVDYAAGAGTDSTGAATFTKYAANLDGMKADLAAVSVNVLVKALTPPRDLNFASITGSSGVARGEAWRAFLGWERNRLQRLASLGTGWGWVDTMKLSDYAESSRLLLPTILIDGGQLPNGATVDYPITHSTGGSGLYVLRAYITSDTATAASSTGNEWCFNVRNTSLAVNLGSADTCTTSNELAAGVPKPITINQNFRTTSAAQGLACRVTESGAAPSLAAANMTCSLDISTGAYASESSWFSDDRHFGTSGFRAMAESFYATLTGLDPTGAH